MRELKINKHTSRRMLREAVYAGKIEKPKQCSKCGKQPNKRLIHGHHHVGYSRWWDVVWLCLWCHRKADGDKMILRGGKNGMVRHPEKSFLVTNNPIQKLTAEKATKIREMAKTMHKAEVAAKMGVTLRNVFYIVARKTWRNCK